MDNLRAWTDRTRATRVQRLELCRAPRQVLALRDDRSASVHFRPFGTVLLRTSSSHRQVCFSVSSREGVNVESAREACPASLSRLRFTRLFV
jgi:hypothetical protein